MPGVVLARATKSNPFSLRIDNKTVDRFVEADNFGGYKMQCESESIWDFWTDNIDISLDVSVLDFLGYDESNYHNMEKLPAELRYYGRRVFGGVIGDLSFSKDDQSLELELHSYGRVIKGINFSMTRYGFTAQKIAERILLHVNGWLTLNGYPFTLDNLQMDIIDFPFYHSLKRALTVDYNNSRTANYTGSLGLYIRGAQAYIVYPTANGQQYRAHPIETATLKFSLANYITLSNLKDYVTGIENYTTDEDDADGRAKEQAKFDAVYNIIQADSDNADQDSGFGYKLHSVIRDPLNNTGYLAEFVRIYGNGQFADIKLVRYAVSNDDVFFCKYTNGKAGDMLRDLAIMTNSYVWIGPDTTVYFQTREYGISELPAVNPINYSTSIIRRDNDFEIPEAYLVLDDVKDSVTDYFNSFLAGDFYGVKTSFFKEEIGNGNFAFMLLRDLPVKPSLQKGLVKSADFIEDIIEIESEFRVSG